MTMNAIFAVLGDLHRQAARRPIGNAIIEGLFGFQHHGEITARVGVNKDGSATVFTTNEDLGKLIVQVLERRPRLHVKTIEGMSQNAFERLLSSDEWRAIVLSAAGVASQDAEDVEDPNDAYKEDCEFVYKPPWPAVSARGYAAAMVAELHDADLAPDMEFESEGRTRSALNEALGWKADELNQAVEAIHGPLSDAVELYAMAPESPLGSIVLESMAALQEHMETSVLLGVNQDGSCNLFCFNSDLVLLVAKAIREMRGGLHVANVPRVEPEWFATMAWDETLREVLNQRDSEVEHDKLTGKETRPANQWPELAARAFVKSLVDRLDISFDRAETVEEPPPPPEPIPAVAHIEPLSVRKKMALIEALREPDAVISEARFRALLHGVMHWGERRLDEAVNKILSDAKGGEPS